MIRTKPAPMLRTKLPNTQLLESRIYQGVKALLHDRSRAFCARTGLPFDEIRSYADLVFCYVLRRYDDQRGVKFSTLLYSALHNGFVDYVRVYNRQNMQALGKRLHTLSDEEPIDPIDLLEDEVAVRQYNLLENLSSMEDVAEELFEDAIPSECREYAADALELIELAVTGLGSDIESLQQLTERLGWSSQRFANACEVVKAAVNSW